jgi:hypothetical protein
MKIKLILIVILLATSGVSQVQTRIWTSFDGRTFEGEYVNKDIETKTVTLKGINGAVFTTPIDRFPDDDQKLINTLKVKVPVDPKKLAELVAKFPSEVKIIGTYVFPKSWPPMERTVAGYQKNFEFIVVSNLEERLKGIRLDIKRDKERYSKILETPVKVPQSINDKGGGGWREYVEAKSMVEWFDKLEREYLPEFDKLLGVEPARK